MVSVMVSFCAVFFPRGVLDEILNLIETVSEGFPSYSIIGLRCGQRNSNDWGRQLSTGDDLSTGSISKISMEPDNAPIRLSVCLTPISVCFL